MAGLDSVIVDTSTVLALNGWPRADQPKRTGFDLDRLFERDLVTGAIEALVLFEHIKLDGPSIDLNRDTVGWLDEAGASLQIERPDRATVDALYGRAASLLRSVTLDELGDPDPRNWLSITECVGRPDYLRHQLGVSWWDINEALQNNGSVCLAAIAEGLENSMGSARGQGPPDVQVIRLLDLMRFYYYLALQERIGGALLVHPWRAAAGGYQAPQFGFAGQILGAFDERVRLAYRARRQQWLGDTPKDIPLPPLTRFVRAEAERRSWNLGRTILWLREQPEVHSFRRGMRQLMDVVDSDDHVAVDAVLSELDAAATAWAAKLGTSVRPTHRLSIQVSLPFIQPATEIAVPLPARTAGQRMLTLITRVMDS